MTLLRCKGKPLVNKANTTSYTSEQQPRFNPCEFSNYLNAESMIFASLEPQRRNATPKWRGRDAVTVGEDTM